MSGTSASDAVVVGAGVMGTAIALELARGGRSVVVVDKASGPGFGSTSASSAIIRFTYSTPDGVALSWEAYHRWIAWAEHLGVEDHAGLARFQRVGMAFLDSPVMSTERTTALLAGAGVPYEVWDADEVERRIAGIDAGSWFPPKPVTSPEFADDPVGRLGAVFTPEHRALADALAAQSITLLRDDARLVPLDPEAHPFVFETPALAGLGALLGETAMSIGEQPTHAEIRLAAGLASQGRPVLVGVADVKRNPTQVDLVDALVKTGAPVIVVALRDPYDLLAMPAGPTLLATYGSPPPSLRALKAVLRGESPIGGRLPVELTGLFPIGIGLTR